MDQRIEPPVPLSGLHRRRLAAARYWKSAMGKARKAEATNHPAEGR